jgi:hypothetical protein
MSDLRTELLRIREKRGSLTPRIVYEEAKKRTHPLHSQVFDVPQAEAAERYYISNAQRLLRVTFRADVEGKPMDLRSFLVVKGTEESPGNQYVPIEEIAQDPIARTVTLQQMRREWQRFKNRYSNYQEFFDMLSSEITNVDPDEEFGDSDGTNG